VKEREEQRNGRTVTVVEKEPKDLPPEQRQAMLEAKIATLEADVAELKKLASKPVK